MSTSDSFFRGRRLRNSNIRKMLHDVRLHLDDLVMPVFVKETSKKVAKEYKNPIESMPGIYQFSQESVVPQVELWMQMGIKRFILFGIPAQKDVVGSGSLKTDGIIPTAIRAIKSRFPEATLISDICLCEYTSHGHCGLLDSHGAIKNDETRLSLSQQAVVHAQAGVDVLAPSAMCDGMVSAMRKALDKNHYKETPILSYAVKYASAFYGPFREAAQSPPQFGTRENYQMHPACSTDQAVAEALADIDQGADMIMVKPALAYLDVLETLKQHPNINTPLAAYQVSGEYAMLVAADEKGWLELDATVVESLTAIRRAGAKIIISYFTEHLANKLQLT